MDNTFKQFLESGKKMLTDTKLPRQLQSKKAPAKMDEPTGDSHQTFVKRTIAELPKRSEIIDELKKFVAVAEKEIGS